MYVQESDIITFYIALYKGNALKQVKEEFSYWIYFIEWSYANLKVVWFFLDIYKIYIKLGPIQFGKHRVIIIHVNKS